MEGVTFGTKHSYYDFGLILSSKDIGIPEPKIKTVEVPGADGVIDLTEILTNEVKYKNRKLTFTFTVVKSINLFQSSLSKINNYLHGKKMHIILDDDKSFYYIGRCTVNQFKSNKRLGTIVIECDCDPYKYDLLSSTSQWEWDTFSFADGIIYDNNITVTNSATVTLLNRRKIVSPTFTCTAAMTVLFDNKTYNLPQGTTTVLDIRLQEGENIVTFTGNGTVNIEYKGGSL